MNRRSFLRGIAGGVAALLLPQDPEQRFFQLDKTMIRPKISPPEYNYSLGVNEFIEAMENAETPWVKRLREEQRRIKKELESAMLWGRDEITNLDPHGPIPGSYGYNHYTGQAYVFYDEGWYRI